MAHKPYVEPNFIPGLPHREPLSRLTVGNYQELGARK